MATLLVVAGALEVHRPDSTVGALRELGAPVPTVVVRAGAVLGAVLGAAALVADGGAFGSIVAALVAVAYLAFTAFVAVALLRDTPIASCGCFGRDDTPPSVTHIVLNLAAAGVAAAVAVSPGSGISGVVSDQPGLGIPFVLMTAACGFLAYLAYTRLPRTLALARGDRLR
ncbi:MAG: MauE/DoxX family redox-associated membrane protein [Acidimicrobiia bacterium]